MVRGMAQLRIPSTATSAFAVTLRFIPKAFMEASKILAAREARILGGRRVKVIWSVLTASLGDLIVRGFHTAWMLDKAVKARSFSASKPKTEGSNRRFNLNFYDTVLLASTIVLTLVFAASEGVL